MASTWGLATPAAASASTPCAVRPRLAVAGVAGSARKPPGLTCAASQAAAAAVGLGVMLDRAWT